MQGMDWSGGAELRTDGWRLSLGCMLRDQSFCNAKAACPGSSTAVRLVEWR